MKKNELLMVCSRGIYAASFPEGYLIFTESLEDAQAVCRDLALGMSPFWYPLVKTYDSLEEAQYDIRQILSLLGPAGASLVELKQAESEIQVVYYGFISAK